jgi:hypothetical protein
MIPVYMGRRVLPVRRRPVRVHASRLPAMQCALPRSRPRVSPLRMLMVRQQRPCRPCQNCRVETSHLLPRAPRYLIWPTKAEPCVPELGIEASTYGRHLTLEPKEGPLGSRAGHKVPVTASWKQ